MGDFRESYACTSPDLEVHKVMGSALLSVKSVTDLDLAAHSIIRWAFLHVTGTVMLGRRVRHDRDAAGGPLDSQCLNSIKTNFK